MPLELRDVTIRRDPSDAPILENLSCTFADGEITLLLGATGAGKSTLLRATAGVWDLQAGEVRYDGMPLWSTGRRRRLTPALQRRIGYVFQQPEQQLFARTVEQEFRYSLRPYQLGETELRDRISAALADVNLTTSLLDESPLLLSGGQKRRVALATTLATEPDWLFLDEPTAGLDAEAARRLLSGLHQRLQRPSGGIVIATHDLDWMLPMADRVLVLQEGQIAFDGAPATLYANPRVLVETGIGLSESMEAMQALRKVGVVVDPTEPAPDEVARAIAEHLKSGAPLSPVLEPAQGKGDARKDARTRPQASERRPAWWFRRDPRAKWLFVLLASIGVLLQRTWPGILIAAVATLLIAATSGVSGRRYLQVLKPLVWLAMASGVVSGIRLGHAALTATWHFGAVGYAWPAASITLAQIVKVMLIVAISTLLSGTTSTLDMKRGLEQGLRGLSRFRIPVGAFALGTALLLRFIPVVSQEAMRFSEIVRIRGKYPIRSGALRLRDLSAMLLPLLLSVLRLGEDLALAMEARGYRPTAPIRPIDEEDRADRKDILLAALGGGWLIVFVALRLWLP